MDHFSVSNLHVPNIKASYFISRKIDQIIQIIVNTLFYCGNPSSTADLFAVRAKESLHPLVAIISNNLQ